MGVILNYNNKLVLRHLQRLNELNWPSENFVKNVANVNIEYKKEKDIIKYFKNYKVHDYSNYLCYNERAMSFFRRELIQLSRTRTVIKDIDLIRAAVDENPMVYNDQGLINLVIATDFYLQSLIYNNEEIPSMYPDQYVFVTAIMAMAINKMGIDNFIKKYFNNDYSCLTSDIENIFGTNLTKELYDYAAGNTLREDKQLFEKIINIHGKESIQLLEDLNEQYKKGLIYRIGQNKYNKLEKKYSNKTRKLHKFNPFKK